MNTVSQYFIESVTNTLFASSRTVLVGSRLGKWSSIASMFKEYQLRVRPSICEATEVDYMLYRILPRRLQAVTLSKALKSWKEHNCAITSVYIKGRVDRYPGYKDLSAKVVDQIGALFARGTRRVEAIWFELFDNADLRDYPGIMRILDSISAVGGMYYRDGGPACVPYFLRWALQGIAIIWMMTTYNEAFVSRAVERAIMRLALLGQLRQLELYCNNSHREFHKRIVRYVVFGARNEKFQSFGIHEKFLSSIQHLFEKVDAKKGNDAQGKQVEFSSGNRKNQFVFHYYTNADKQNFDWF